jgi:hypothetical protein
VQSLGAFRTKSTALKTGNMMQYIPEDGLYVYFRYDQHQTVMCVMNTDTKTRNVSMSKYTERTNGFNGGKDILTGNIVGAEFSIPSMSMQVIELTK